jgi:hypothetical protein
MQIRQRQTGNRFIATSGLGRIAAALASAAWADVAEGRGEADTWSAANDTASAAQFYRARLQE